MEHQRHSQPSMQSLLHSPSSPGDDQDILQPQSSPLGSAYISAAHNSADIWSFSNHSNSHSSLQEKVQALGELRLPPQTTMDKSSPLSRFMTDESASRPLVEVNNLASINTGYMPQGHNTTHLSIATSWYEGYQRQYHDDAVSSAVSSIYEYPYRAGETVSPLSGSPDGHRFQEAGYALDDTPSTSPIYHHGHTHGGTHSHRSSMDECLSSASPGFNQTWRKTSGYSTGSDGSAAPAPIPVASEHSLGHQGSYVNLKSIQLAPEGEDKDDKDEDPADTSFQNRRPERDSIPDIYVNGQEHSDHEHDHTSSWHHDQQDHGQYYTLAPMEVECSSSSPEPPPESSPQSTRLEAKRERRRSRSGSGASQLSSKARAELMKPYKDMVTSPTGKNHKGRGAGKKTKEKQCCPEHPNKVFKHNSDFRYSALPPPLLPLPPSNAQVKQLTALIRSKHMQTQHTRPFLCTFYFAECMQTFGSKNEWKRHVFSQHLQLHYWRCDYADCVDRKAFFNRKDLFGQHLKRMHGPKPNLPKNSPEMKIWLAQTIPQIQERCKRERRSAPEWSKCGYCETEFSGTGSWDARMEHVGKHYEKNNYKDIDPLKWVMDEGLISWAIGVRIIERTETGDYRLICSGKDSIEDDRNRNQAVMRLGINDKKDADADEDVDADGDYEY